MFTLFLNYFSKLLPRSFKACQHIKHEFENKTPQNSQLGFKFHGNKRMESGQFEPIETQIIETLLDQSSLLINIGANIGYYCCIALNKKIEVVAFEPIRRNLEFLLRNVEANNWSKLIEVYPMALSDTKGIIKIFGGGTGASLIEGWAGTPSQYVDLSPCTTVDAVIGNRFIDKKILVVVDIEGAELMMLNGADSLLNRINKPIWMIEIAVSEHQPSGIKINPSLLLTFKKFWDAGYISFIADNTLTPVYEEQIQLIASTNQDTLNCHNFIFIDPIHANQINILARFLKT
jgi:FkbM family methyltransferase